MSDAEAPAHGGARLEARGEDAGGAGDLGGEAGAYVAEGGNVAGAYVDDGAGEGPGPRQAGGAGAYVTDPNKDAGQLVDGGGAYTAGADDSGDCRGEEGAGVYVAGGSEGASVAEPAAAETGAQAMEADATEAPEPATGAEAKAPQSELVKAQSPPLGVADADGEAKADGADAAPEYKVKADVDADSDWSNQAATSWPRGGWGSSSGGWGKSEDAEWSSWGRRSGDRQEWRSWPRGEGQDESWRWGRERPGQEAAWPQVQAAHGQGQVPLVPRPAQRGRSRTPPRSEPPEADTVGQSLREILQPAPPVPPEKAPEEVSSHPLLKCLPPQIRAEVSTATTYDQLVERCSARRSQEAAWPDLNLIGGGPSGDPNKDAMRDLSDRLLTFIEEQTVQAAEAAPSSVDQVAAFVATNKLSAATDAAIRKLPATVRSRVIRAGPVIGFDKDATAMARSRRALRHFFQAKGAMDALSAETFLGEHWIATSAEKAFRAISEEAQREVMRNGPLLGPCPQKELTERIERAEAEEQAKADERLLAALAAGDADLEEKAGLGAAPGAAPGATEGAAPTEPQPMTWWGQ